jgi:arylsulfatase A-like enzyme
MQSSARSTSTLTHSAILATAALLLACSCGQKAQLAEQEIFDLVEQRKWAPETRRSTGVVADEETGALTLPAKGKIDYFLHLPPKTKVSVEAIKEASDSTTASHITLVAKCAGDGQSLGRSGRWKLSHRKRSASITGKSSEICKVSLVNRSEQSVDVVRPRVVSSQLTGKADQQGDHVPDAGTGASAEKPNIILYLVDTLRSDRVGVYGHDGKLTPAIDEFARQAVVFEDSVAQSPWTRPSVASIFTGLDPYQHTVNNRDDALSEQAVTMAELLAGAGYTTASFISNGNVGVTYGFDQGFEIFSNAGKGSNYSDQLNENLFPFLDSSHTSQPFFLNIHTLDPHAPYTPPDDYRQMFAVSGFDPKKGEQDFLRPLKRKRRKMTRQGLPLDEELSAGIISLYEAEVAFNDRSFGRFIDKLKELDLYDDSLIIFLADHGEEFWEHGDWAHGHTLYYEVINVPLIIKAPNQTEADRASELVQHIDIFSTVLDYAGVTYSGNVRGRSLRERIEQGTQVPPQPVFATVDLDGRTGVSVTNEDWKLIVPRSRPVGTRPMLFNRLDDPEERHDLAGERPIITGYMMTLLRWHEYQSQQQLEATTAVADEELTEELRALGYLE